MIHATRNSSLHIVPYLPWALFALAGLAAIGAACCSDELNKIAAISGAAVALMWGLWLGAFTLHDSAARDQNEFGYVWGIGYFPACAAMTVGIPCLVASWFGIASGLRTQAWPQAPAKILEYQRPSRSAPASVLYEYTVAGVARRSTGITPSAASRDLSSLGSQDQCCYNPSDPTEAYLFCDVPLSAILAGCGGGCLFLFAVGNVLVVYSWAGERAARLAELAAIRAARRAKTPKSP